MNERRLQYIPVERIHEHPDNPRKALGDLTELSDSIKANGILQNLTVVPMGDDEYTVIIGHRRLAAAKQAGLSTVPCVVAEGLSELDQQRTMLMENIQRSDLTLYEQAQGFQLMMDLGDTVQNISKSSGFSVPTVRHRLAMAKLDEGKFKAGAERGATIMDFIELEKVEDIEKRNKLLESIGTANFKYELKKTLDMQLFEANAARAAEVLGTFASRVYECDYNSMKTEWEYVSYNIGGFTLPAVPVDVGEKEYFYIIKKDMYSSFIKLFSKIDKSSGESTEESEARLKEAAYKAKLEEQYNTALAMQNDFMKLQRDFVKGFNNESMLTREACKICAYAIFDDCCVNPKLVSDVLGIAYDEKTDYISIKEWAELKDALEKNPGKALIAIMLSRSGWDEYNHGVVGRRYGDGSYRLYYDNDNMSFNNVFRSLANLCYPVGREELLFFTGKHEIFGELKNE